jgi:hypothetical protein
MAFTEISPTSDPITGERTFTIAEGVGVGGYSFKKTKKVSQKLLRKASTWGVFAKGKTRFIESDTEVAILRNFDDNADIIDLPGDPNSYSFGLSLPKEGAAATLIYRDNDIIAAIYDNTSVYENGAYII